MGNLAPGRISFEHLAFYPLRRRRVHANPYRLCSRARILAIFVSSHCP
jgi:hypothetical protein